MIVYLQVLRYTSDMLLLCDNNSITTQRVEQEATGEVLLNSRCIKYITIAFCFCDLRRLITLTTKSLYAVKFYHTVSVSYFLKKDVTQFKDMRKRLGKALCWKKKKEMILLYRASNSWQFDLRLVLGFEEAVSFFIFLTLYLPVF